ncbi:MAG: bestrophin-like domain [Mycobacterium sp.]
MSYWIVSNVPSWLLLLGLIVLIAGGAVLIQFCVRHWFPGFMEGASNDSINFSFRAIALVYAVFIGFVVSAMWGQINGADNEARLEGTAGVQLSRDLTVFDTADSDRVRQSLLEYQRAAVAEWPRAAQGLSSPEVDTALRRLYTAYQEVQPRSETEKMLLATSFNNLDTLSRARTDRILLARTDTGPPPSLWTVILITSGLVLGLVIVQRADTPAIDYAMVALVGVLVAAQLFLVLVLSHPYIGEIATSPEPLLEVGRVLSPAA